MAEYIVRIDPSIYRKYIWKNNKKKTNEYIQMRKPLYLTLQATLLFWRELQTRCMSGGSN